MKKKWSVLFTCLALVALALPAHAYEAFSGPLGLLQYTKGKTFDGYTLISPQKATITYLIDMEGNVINEWKSDYLSFYAELMPNGNMVRHSVLPEAYPRFGGTAGILEEFDWSGKKVFEYKFFTPDKEVGHHTFEVMPNGNFLILGWEYKSFEEALAKGLDADNPDRLLFAEGFRRGQDVVKGIWPDFIREVDHQGKTVWEWHVWDHLGQAADQWNINKFLPPRASRTAAGPDWTHFNGIAYDPKTDLICVTSRSLGEVYVIDKKTGNMIFRWGNPANYDAGRYPAGHYDDGDQYLFGPHAPDWTAEGNISVLNNGDNRPTGNYTTGLEINLKGEKVWEWKPTDVGTVPSNFYSFNQSGAQKLPNGNWLISATQPAHVIEVTPQKEIVWEFINPMGADNKVYSTASRHGQMQNFWLHKAMRYGKDVPRFQGKDMSVKRALMPAGTPNWVELLRFNSAPDTFTPK